MRYPAAKLALAIVAAVTLLAPAARAQELPVVVVPGLSLADLAALAPRGAVGLLVPGAGPETSAELARAALARGQVENSLRGGIPPGGPLIEVQTARAAPAGPAIVLGLPEDGRQPNDRRYPIAVLAEGYEGLLDSESTRIPGLVSIADVAPTALGMESALESRPAADPVAELASLDRRIEANGDVRPFASLAVAVLIAVLVPFSGRAALLGFATALAANLALGLGGVSAFWAVLLVIALAVATGAPVLAAILRSPVAVGVVLGGVVAAYLGALAADPAGVALSPLGPTQNSRFHGLSNLLATMLLVPTLAGAAFLGRRFGPIAFAAVGLLALATVASSSLGADGGGAIVLAVGLVVLAAGLWRLSALRLALVVGAALALIGLAVGLEAAAGVSSHITDTFEGGPGEWASDLAERVELSWRRATDHPGTAAAVATGLVGFALLTGRAFQLDRSRGALPIAFAIAIVTSLVVNDSPLEVTLAGLVGLMAIIPTRSSQAAWKRGRARPG